MGISILMRLWALIPKWLLVGLVACFFAYFTGVSHGRAPYKLAAKVQKSVGKVFAMQVVRKDLKIDQKMREANEISKNNKFIFSADDARVVRDILAQ